MLTGLQVIIAREISKEKRRTFLTFPSMPLNPKHKNNIWGIFERYLVSIKSLKSSKIFETTYFIQVKARYDWPTG